MKHHTIVPVALATTALTLTACTIADTAPDEQALRYNHGLTNAQTFEKCVSPSMKEFSSPTDAVYTYPAGQRVYNFIAQNGDGDPFEVVTKDGISLKVEGATRFTLTDDCDRLKQFHEKIGIKTEAYTPDGWVKFLNIYLRAPINRALTDATQNLGWQDIYSNPQAKAKWEKQVSELLPKYVEQTIGGDYLENFSVTLQKPTLPDELEKALQATQVATQNAAAQKQQNEAVKTELESIRALVAVLGPDGYNVYQAIKSGKIQVMPIPQGSSVVVDNKKQQ